MWDYAGMPEKGRLIRAVDPALAGRIRCIGADLKRPGKGIRPAAETRMGRVEAVGPWFTGGDLVLSGRGGAGGSDRDVRTGRNRGPAGIPATRQVYIKGEGRHPRRRVSARYPARAASGPSGTTRRGVRRTLGPAGNAVRVHDLRDMERSRLGRNVHFKGKRSGWIQVCEFVI